MNVGLVGLGFIGKTHLEAYQHLSNCQVKAIWTTDGEKAREITNKIENINPLIVTEFADLLANENIDVIDICLPTFLHEKYIIQAANAGKHIICEKPLTLTVESAKRIIDVVEKNDVRLFVGHVLRFWPEYELIKSYIRRYLTDMDVIHAKRLGQVPTWSNWFQYPDKSGGALFDLHIHEIDYMSYVVGEVKSVFAVGCQNSYGAWDHIMTTVTFENNVKAFLEASHRMPTGYPFTMSFRAQAREGTIDLFIAAGENIEQMDDRHHRFIYYTDEEIVHLEANEGDAFQNELGYFIDCLKNNQTNKVIPLRDVLYTLKIMEAIKQSLEIGREIEV